MSSLTIHCPGCETLMELETLIIKGDDWRCSRQCIGFKHMHRVSDHSVVEVTKHRARDAADQTVRLAARARCSWSGAFVVLADEEVVHG